MVVMKTTRARGRALLLAALRSDGLELEAFVKNLEADRTTPRAARTAVYAVADPSTVPQALLHNMKHNQVLHARNVVLTIDFADRPWVDDAERVSVQALGAGFWRVRARFLGDFNRLRRTERLGYARHGLDGLRKHVLLEIAAGNRDPQPADALRGAATSTGSTGRVEHAASSASGPCIAS